MVMASIREPLAWSVSVSPAVVAAVPQGRYAQVTATRAGEVLQLLERPSPAALLSLCVMAVAGKGAAVGESVLRARAIRWTAPARAASCGGRSHARPAAAAPLPRALYPASTPARAGRARR